MTTTCLDCGALIPKGPRCRACRSVREQQRGTPAQRGYGASHQRARATLRAALPDLCAYGCGTLLYPEGDWVAAHVVDGDPTAGWVAACRTCNERAKHRGVANVSNAGNMEMPSHGVATAEGVDRTARGFSRKQSRGLP